VNEEGVNVRKSDKDRDTIKGGMQRKGVRVGGQ
jgi:hypothetical protein